MKSAEQSLMEKSASLRKETNRETIFVVEKVDEVKRA
jgi:hypothetical protein